MRTRLVSGLLMAEDFEFVSGDGDQPRVVCHCARNFESGREERTWLDGRTNVPPPVRHPDSVLVAFSAQAEIGCYLALGWPPPRRILDLGVEFRLQENGRRLRGFGLLDALDAHDLHVTSRREDGLIHVVTRDYKHAMRELVRTGGPWSPSERDAILDYCMSDCVALCKLLEVML